MPKEIFEGSSNSELVLELIGILKEEASLFETFLELLEQQQKALVANDLIRLNEITERQREKLVAAGILGRRREQAVAELAAQGNLGNDVTVSRLIESLSSGQKTVLEQVRETIMDLNEKIGRVRSQNEMLINHSRENIMKTMELLGRIKTPESSYHSEGRRKSSPTSLALDRRA